MIFTETPLSGVWSIGVEPRVDERGFFARTWCAEEFHSHGLSVSLTQVSISFNRQKGTLRGMHFQHTPHEETKLVRCTRGAIFDVVIDLRPASSTYGQWYGKELSADNHLALYIPGGCAHGFQTLYADTEVLYSMASSYVPEAADGVRWDDPAFGIVWPLAPIVMSDRDRTYPNVQLVPVTEENR